MLCSHIYSDSLSKLWTPRLRWQQRRRRGEETESEQMEKARPPHGKKREEELEEEGDNADRGRADRRMV